MYFLVLSFDALLYACCRRRSNRLTWFASPLPGKRCAAVPRQRESIIQCGVALWDPCVKATLAPSGNSGQATLRPADAPEVRPLTTRPSLENALAASYAGVVHPLHALAGIDSARPLLFSGDAISYVSKRRAQSTPNFLNCAGDVSLLNGELALPVLWVARVSRLIGNSDTTAKAHHWQGGRTGPGDWNDAQKSERGIASIPAGRADLRPDARNATPMRVASQGSYAGHWPPSELN